jgi:hypothetical protein
MSDPVMCNEENQFVTAEVKKRGASRKAAKNGNPTNPALFNSYFASLRLCAKIVLLF